MKLSELSNPVETLGGIGPAATRQFARLNIFTVSDLLSTYPRDYEDRSCRIPLKDFALHPKVHTICKVTAHEWFGYGRMRTLKIAVTDGTAEAWLIAFNRAFLEKSLPEGSIISVTGHFEVRYNELQCTSFEAERLSYEGELSEYENAGIPGSGVLPVYPLTEGLSQKNYRKAVVQALKLYGKALDDELPTELYEERKLLHKADALNKIHCPSSIDEAAAARKTFIYEELYQFEYALAKRVKEHRGKLLQPEESDCFPDELKSGENNNDCKEKAAEKNSFTEKEIKAVKDTSASETENEDIFTQKLSPRQKQLLQRLGFELTSDQKKVIAEMNSDIDRSAEEFNTLKNNPELLTHTPFSMQRLLQGDVGSGKTLVCFFVALRIIDYGGQCALMAPTELLARQHAENAALLLEPLDVRVAFLTGNVKAKGRGPLLDSLKNGTINIVIGTHALFSHNVIYKNLQLAVIDEQHRFGVTQREAIVAKGRTSNGKYAHSPDLLMMSATPIPQSLALTVFGDLDVSSIHTMPSGRKEIKTYLSVEGHESNVYEAVRKELQNGRQAYFVYPLINALPAKEDAGSAETGSSLTDESLELSESSGSENNIKAAEEMFKFLSQKVFPEYKCALVHGQIDDESQNKILTSFQKNEIQILVATTVVEVGVDVANATCMVIEKADRFGLAQLHQLRGRVGRSSLQSYCFLVYSKNITETGILRMKALRQNTDGFVIAEEDFRLRGPGEILGTAQSGNFTLGIADPVRDKEILKLARYDAIKALKDEEHLQ